MGEERTTPRRRRGCSDTSGSAWVSPLPKHTAHRWRRRSECWSPSVDPEGINLAGRPDRQTSIPSGLDWPPPPHLHSQKGNAGFKRVGSGRDAAHLQLAPDASLLRTQHTASMQGDSKKKKKRHLVCWICTLHISRAHDKSIFNDATSQRRKEWTPVNYWASRGETLNVKVGKLLFKWRGAAEDNMPMLYPPAVQPTSQAVQADRQQQMTSLVAEIDYPVCKDVSFIVCWVPPCVVITANSFCKLFIH